MVGKTRKMGAIFLAEKSLDMFAFFGVVKL